LDDDLRALAAAHGVATAYEDNDHRLVTVAGEVVVAVLAELGVHPGDPLPVRPALPDPLVIRQGETPEVGGPAELSTEDGSVYAVRGRLPADLPLGWHRLAVGEREITLVVTPRRLPAVPPAWGWQVQLYALHSPGSWGVGDLADLREFAAGSGRLGAGVLLVNPVQAITPGLPVQRSPYSPSSRRFANPLYLRIDGPSPVEPAGLIDYDAVYAAKLAALERRWAGQVSVAELDPALRDFATFCALAERHGPDWRRWPARLRHPANPEVAAARAECADRVAFHAWLQRLCAEQLDEVHQTAQAAGTKIVHDLPVGVDPAGADAWALQDVLASSVTVGAPPDAFSQQGQDWNLPPWHPERLAEAGYRPFRDVIHNVLAHADGIRVDHIAGLWRLWWIPPGHPPSEGTYVHYDADALLGILALEAHRASAMVVGEDLGTVPDEVTATLHERGVLSSAVLWFQRDEAGALLPPKQWPAEAMASISTHDLPTAAGFLRAEHVRVRAERGLLTDPEAEHERSAAERAELLDVLAAHDLLPAEVTEENLVAALHALLATAASTLLLASPQDALGDHRQPNLPGTVDEYPNWRIRLDKPVAELLADQRLLRAAAALRAARPRPLR
jgi:4-alpha-glucanotransferase